MGSVSFFVHGNTVGSYGKPERTNRKVNDFLIGHIDMYLDFYGTSSATEPANGKVLGEELSVRSSFVPSLGQQDVPLFI